MTTSASGLPQTTAASLLAGRKSLAKVSALIGFDGFVDNIYYSVDKRKSATEYTRIPTLKAYGERIAAAAGKSANIEVVCQAVKLGGNGPIMANAMGAQSVPLTYCGMIGDKEIHPVFAELAKRSTAIGISEPAVSDAMEFDDGKLIVGKHATVANVTYENIIKFVGAKKWADLWNKATFVGVVNWTMLPHLTDLWKKIQKNHAPKKGEARKTMFIDLCDPSKRPVAELQNALKVIAAFQKQHDVILGLNESEGVQVGKALGIECAGRDEASITKLAADIRAKLGIHTCVVHPVAFAAAADATGAVCVPGPFTPKPKISTGAGDHFNAGFCVGRILGLDLAQALQTGVGTSGYYVRNAASPSVEQLAKFLKSL